MSGRRDPDPVVRLVGRVLEDESRTRAPDRMLEGVFSRTKATRQARRRPWDRLDLPGTGGAPALALAVVALMAAAGLVAVAGGARPAPAPTPPTSAASVAPPVLAAVCATGGGISGGQGTLWVRCPTGIRRIDATGPQAKAGPVLDGLGLPVEAAGGLWAPGQGTVAQLDPATGDRLRTLSIAGTSILAGSPDALWALAGDRLERIDPASGDVTRSPGSIREPMAIVFAGGSPWVTSSDGNLYRFDPATLTITATIPVGDAPEAMAADDAAVYVVSQGNAGTVTRIDIATDGSSQAVIAGATDPRSLGQIAVGENGLFVTRRTGLVQLDPATLAVRSVTSLPAYPSGLLIDGTTLWVFGESGRLDRLVVAPGGSAAPPS